MTLSRATIWRRANPEKARAAVRRHFEKNQQKVRDYHRAYRRKRAGLPEPTRPEPSNCECCGVSDSRLRLDHCHETGAFRGWICQKCNTGIGMLGDTRVAVERAISYLQRSKVT